MSRREQEEHEHGEKRRLLAARWEALPSHLQSSNQLIGRAAVACGATHHVMERCNFSCTCCYLGPEANKTEPLPFAEVQEQLDTLRAELGVRSRVQITAGEVTLLPLAELGRIVRYALEIGLDPMVMTHGQRFLDDPEYLISLVRDYGLRKVSIHVDSTQRGRPGWNASHSETDLHRVREDFAELILRVRRETGARLQAASTVTVTSGNIDEVPALVRWFLEHADTFRLLSFQPVADVGRTRRSQTRDMPESDRVWQGIDQGFGFSVNRSPMHFGHPDCNTTAPFLIVRVGEKPFVFEAVRSGHEEDAVMMSRVVDALDPDLGHVHRRRDQLRSLGGFVFKHPKTSVRLMRYVVVRSWQEKHRILQVLWEMIRSFRLPSIRFFLLVIHRFMSPGELETELGRERLDACVFKVPVDGELVSMCEMNASGIREKLDRMQIGRA